MDRKRVTAQELLYQYKRIYRNPHGYLSLKTEINIPYYASILSVHLRDDMNNFFTIEVYYSGGKYEENFEVIE